MGSCISKCKPSKKEEKSAKKRKIDKEEGEDHVQLQDKLVIVASQNNPPLKSPSPPQKTQNPNLFLSPLSPSPSHSSCSSSFSCTTGCHNSSSSSSSSASSCSSSISISKDFSPLKQTSQTVLLDRTQKPAAGGAPPPSLPPHKRQRASSPNLARQKSFRRDPVGPTLLIPSNKPSPLRSPSPSRRFVNNGGAMNCNFKGNGSFRKGNNTFNSVKREPLKGLNDFNNKSRRSIRSPSMRKETQVCSLKKVVSRVDGISIKEERGQSCLQEDVEMLPVEDLDNPLIALDCFIFL